MEDPLADKPTVFVTRKLPDVVEDRLRRDFHARLNANDAQLSGEDVVAGSAGADALLITPTEKLRAEVIEQLPETVRAIATFSVGFDHIDLAAAKARNIAVANTPEVLSDATAEVAMLLMLAAARRAHEGERLVRTGAWRDWSPTCMLGTQVTGKRLGIVGMGRIGRTVARMASGFSMQIHYHGTRRLAAEVAHGAIFHERLEDLLAVSDFLSLHCPATPQTVGLLNAERIARLPEGAIVVNTARGSIVDDDALIAALKSGHVAAAGLDVYAGEPDIHPDYRALDNVFLLPHIGSATRETRAAMGFRALDNLDAIFAGQAPRDRLV